MPSGPERAAASAVGGRPPDRSTMAAMSRPNVVLREVAKADLDVFFDQQLDPEATAMAAFPVRDRTAHMAHWKKILADEALVARTIDADGQVAGHVGSWVNEHGAREISYWLGRGILGKGHRDPGRRTARGTAP
jgi:RimJ/RimL family protein N-acetyltransferase